MTPISMVRWASLLLVLSTGTSVWQPAVSPEEAVLNVLVWGTHMPIDSRAYSGALRSEVDAYLKRAAAYRAGRPSPARGGVLAMVDEAQVSYERRLVAITADPSAPALAVAHVSELHPCYEWEGYHDCPQREAEFADRYRASHPGGPFEEYLLLLAAHRWVCTAEAFVSESHRDEAERVRRLYEDRIAEARKARGLLIRTAADALARRARCF